MEITDHYLSHGYLSVLPVDYDDVVSASSSIVTKIAKFIGVEASETQIDDIVTRLSRERVAARLEKLGTVSINPAVDIESRSDADLYASIKNADGSYRAYDYKTGFQSNHITSSRTGEWRDVFDAEQQHALNELLCDWLRRYGFDV